MEEKKNLHEIILSDRKEGKVRGVLQVISFDEKTIILETQSGKATIKGEQLHVKQLDVEKGEVALTGKVDAVVYTDEKKLLEGERESIWGRLFR